jgi:hypothetical protein
VKTGYNQREEWEATIGFVNRKRNAISLFSANDVFVEDERGEFPLRQIAALSKKTIK